jgi:pilus assembly protein CpaF
MSFFGPAKAERDAAPAPSDSASPVLTARQREPDELAARRPSLLEEKLKVHSRIIDDFNLSLLDRLPREELAKHVRMYVADYVRAENIALNRREVEAFAAEIVDEMIGYGPIEPLLKDPGVNDILINGHDQCFVERFGRLYETKIHFKDEAHLLRIINKMVAVAGRRVDESAPMVDARLPDDSRVNVAVRPVAVDGPIVSIRKFAAQPLTIERLVELGSLPPPVVDLLSAAVRGRVSLVVLGGTGSGKTTLLNALSGFVPEHERLVTIEDAVELRLQRRHVCRMETRPANIEGRGEIRMRDLVRNALRMRPDRIIVGECRGEEAFDMLQAMNTGHEGSMTTIHANSPRDALKRLEQMVGMADMPMTVASIRGQIAAAIRLLVQVQRLPDGSRRLTSVSEITGLDADAIGVQEIFYFAKEFTDRAGNLKGHFYATGAKPTFLDDVKAFGIDVPDSHFDPARSL